MILLFLSYDAIYDHMSVIKNSIVILHRLFFHDPPFSGAQKVMTLPIFHPPTSP